MKKIYFIILSAFISVIANAQTCSWLKGGASNSTYNEYGQSITTDKKGNVYVTGGFEAATFTLGTTVLNNSHVGSNYGGIFVAKYTADGTLLWAKGADGGASTGITIDKNGNVYIVGSFNPSITFGSYSLTTAGYEDIFVTKYDSLGNVVWAKRAGGPSNGDHGDAITVDNSNNIIITGDFYSSSMTIGTYTFSNPSGSNGPDYFIAKYDPTGNILWASANGGNKYDLGNSVSADANNNMYSIVNFSSDSIKFGSITLYNANSGSGNLGICKYDSLGNIIWVKQIHNEVGSFNGGGSEMAIDSLANLYITSEFGGPMIVGNDTLQSNNGGNFDVFIAKFDSSGNPLWAKSAGSQSNDYSYGISIDKGGNPFITGTFNGTNITFGSSILTNPNTTSNSPAIFITKYNLSGNVLWSLTSTTSGPVIGRGVAVGIGTNLYITGNYNANTLYFPGSSLNTTGNNDFFVADIYPFSSSITSYTNVSCFGGHNGAIIASASGGNIPYQYAWSSSDTSVYLPPKDTAKNLTAGTYIFMVTEGYGCTQTATVTLTQPPADVPSICMVTVDSISQHNIIIWDKTSFTQVDSFIIYREITTNNYQPIASVSFDSLSQFIDTVRTKYFPNTGDPNAGTYRYKIKTHSICGTYGLLSPYHNTIYILNNNGTFYWTQPYTIENGANPVSSYVLMRDNLSNGNWQQVSSVTGTQQTIADPLYSVYQATASWRVQTIWNITCTPTLRLNGNQAVNNTFSSSFSNTYRNSTNSIKGNFINNQISIYPNPTNGSFVVETNSTEKKAVQVFDVNGNLVLTQTINGKTTIDARSLNEGVYNMTIIGNGEVANKRLVIVR